jgi:hypothetical protein
MKSETFRRPKSVPPIVRIVIPQAMRERAGGGITREIFEAQMHRLEHEELEPRGLMLVERGLSGGGTRYLVKEAATGAVCDMMDFASSGTLESDGSDAQSHASTSAVSTR